MKELHSKAAHSTPIFFNSVNSLLIGNITLIILSTYRDKWMPSLHMNVVHVDCNEMEDDKWVKHKQAADHQGLLSVYLAVAGFQENTLF